MAFAQHNFEQIDTMLVSDCGPAVRYVEGGYTLDCLPEFRLVRITIAGFWTETIVQDFARDLLAEVRKVDSGENRHLILCDLSRAVIQSQGTFQGFRDLILNGPTRARKLALTTDSLALRMQARRIVTLRETIRMFAHQDEAMDWLLEGSA